MFKIGHSNACLDLATCFCISLTISDSQHNCRPNSEDIVQTRLDMSWAFLLSKQQSLTLSSFLPVDNSLIAVANRSGLYLTWVKSSWLIFYRVVVK